MSDFFLSVWIHLCVLFFVRCICTKLSAWLTNRVIVWCGGSRSGSLWFCGLIFLVFAMCVVCGAGHVFVFFCRMCSLFLVP